MGNPPWACLRKKDLGWDRGVESKKVVQHVYLVGAKSIYRVAEKDKEYLRDEEEKNQNTAYKNVLDAVEEYFRTLVQRKKEDKLFELERFMAQVYEENGRCEAAEVAALCLANLYNSGGHRKITPDEYETIKKYLQKFPESMHIRAAFIIASEAIYSPSAEYKRVPDKIINKAKQWSEQYPKKIEFQEAYFGLLFSRLKYAQAQDMRNEQRRVYREMKTVAERANYSEYNESNQLMESVDILHRVFGY